MTHAIETVGLRRTFGELVAVDSLDLRVRGGTFFGFLGPNGAGKSTTIKMLTGLLDRSAGTATVLGYDLDRDPVEAKRRIGVVPEELALFDRLTRASRLRADGVASAMALSEAMSFRHPVGNAAWSIDAIVSVSRRRTRRRSAAPAGRSRRTG